MTKKKITLFVGLIFYINIYSYSQINDLEYNQIMWGTDNEEAKNTIVPNKWKSESAVYLYFSESYNYKKQTMNNAINEDIYYRSRVKLLDQTAVNNYAELSMDKLRNNMWGRNGNYLGIKIIKPDGSFRLITENDFVEVESKESGYATQKTVKLALPNLAIGDIIDSYYVSINTYMTEMGNLDIQFNPIVKLLQQEYPILYGEFTVQPERKTFFNAKSYNGAPEPNISISGKWESYVYKYYDLEKMKVDQLVFPYREYPCIISQITMTSKYNKAVRFDFLGEHAKVKSEVSDDEIKSLLLKLCNSDLQDNESVTLEQHCTVQVKKNLSAEPSETEVIENLFYYMRHYLNFKYTLYYGQLIPMANLVTDFQYTIAMSNTLSKYKIEHEIGLAYDRQYTDNNKVIISAQIIPFIRLYNSDSTILTYPVQNTVFGEYFSIIEGSKAVLLDKKSATTKSPVYRSFTLEASTPDDNHITDSIFTNIEDLSQSKISFTESYYIIGSQKTDYYDLVNPFITTYNNEADEYADFNTYRKADFKKIKENKELFEKSKNEYYAQRHNQLEFLLINNQSVNEIDFDTIDVSCMGRWSKKDTLKYQLKYSYQDGINGAGNFFIVDLGRFIGRNKEFTKEEINRKVAIYNDTPLKYDWVLSMNIPQGYKIESLDDLHMSVNNSTGSFSSTARIIDDKLIVDVQKIYKRNYNSLEEWPKVLEFLQAAVNFTQKQILLSPKE